MAHRIKWTAIIVGLGIVGIGCGAIVTNIPTPLCLFGIGFLAGIFGTIPISIVVAGYVLSKEKRNNNRRDPRQQQSPVVVISPPGFQAQPATWPGIYEQPPYRDGRDFNVIGSNDE